MDIRIIIAVLIYTLGYLLCRKMLKIEHDSEKEELTKGGEILLNILSILSFVMVLIMLINAWVGKIKLTGYWNNPAKPKVK